MSETAGAAVLLTQKLLTCGLADADASDGFHHFHHNGEITWPRENPQISVKLGLSPGHDDKEVQSVPRVPEVTSAAKDSQGDHLHDHLQSEENVDEDIESLKAIKRERLADKPLGWKHLPSC